MKKLRALALEAAQKMGTKLDLSAFYLNSQLINFCYCVIEKVVRKFGASSLRN